MDVVVLRASDCILTYVGMYVCVCITYVHTRALSDLKTRSYLKLTAMNCKDYTCRST